MIIRGRANIPVDDLLYVCSNIVPVDFKNIKRNLDRHNLPRLSRLKRTTANYHRTLLLAEKAELYAKTPCAGKKVKKLILKPNMVGKAEEEYCADFDCAMGTVISDMIKEKSMKEKTTTTTRL